MEINCPFSKSARRRAARTHPPLRDARSLAMGRVIRGCRKGKGSVFTSNTHTRKGAAKHRQQVRRRRPARDATGRAMAPRSRRALEDWRAVRARSTARSAVMGDGICVLSNRVDARDGDASARARRGETWMEL